MKGATVVRQRGGLLGVISNETLIQAFQDAGFSLPRPYVWAKSSLVLGCLPYHIGSRPGTARLEEERLARQY